MVQKMIKLQDVSQVKAFNTACMKAPFGIDIRQGKYLIDEIGRASCRERV